MASGTPRVERRVVSNQLRGPSLGFSGANLLADATRSGRLLAVVR